MKFLPDVVGQQYMFGHGRLAVLMRQLFTQTDMDHFLGAHDAQSMLKHFAERPFVAHTSGSFEERTSSVLSYAWKTVTEMIDANSLVVFDILRLPYTVPSIAFGWKSQRSLTSGIAEPPRSPLTLITTDEIISFFKDSDPSRIPLKKELLPLKAMMTKTPDASAEDIDAMVSSWATNLSLKRARRHGSARILLYVRHTIDLTNVRTYMRNHEAGWQRHALQGGLLPLSTFKGDHTTFHMNLARTPYDFLIHTEKGSNEQEWVSLEKAIATLRTEDLHSMWNTTLGPEPVFAFFATIIEQMNCIRALMIGKENGFLPQEIKRALPPFLSASHYAT